MTDLRKAAEMALERLKSHEYWMDEEAIKALRQALAQPQEWKTCRHCGFQYRPPKEDKWHPLAQPEQRPVGTYEGVIETMLSLRKGTLEQQQIYTHMKDKLLYTAPPKREWVGLTDEDLSVFTTEFYNGAVWAEAKLKEKNG